MSSKRVRTPSPQCSFITKHKPAVYQIERYLPPFIRSWIHTKLNSLRTFLVENGILAHPPSDSAAPISSRLSAARNAVTDGDSNLSKDRNRLSELHNDLQADYGPSDVFRALKGTCVDVVSGEYTYEHCIFEKAWQKSNKDHGKTHLGDYTGIERRKDEETGETVVVLKYENGARCWNGPARSAFVYLKCNADEVVESVFEEEKCVYKFTAGSPAVCEGETGRGKMKDEL